MNGERWGGWWRWPLWSWSHLAVTVLVGALFITGLGRASAGDEATSHSDGVAAAQESVATSTNPIASRRAGQVLESSPTTAVAVTDSEPQDVALAFVRAWARPDADNNGWRRSCQALATESYAKVLATASSANVPSSRVLDAVEVERRTAKAARVRVATDGGAVLVDLERTDARWLVGMLQPEQLSSITPPLRSGPWTR